MFCEEKTVTLVWLCLLCPIITINKLARFRKYGFQFCTCIWLIFYDLYFMIHPIIWYDTSFFSFNPSAAIYDQWHLTYDYDYSGITFIATSWRILSTNNITHDTCQYHYQVYRKFSKYYIYYIICCLIGVMCYITTSYCTSTIIILLYRIFDHITCVLLGAPNAYAIHSCAYCLWMIWSHLHNIVLYY